MNATQVVAKHDPADAKIYRERERRSKRDSARETTEDRSVSMAYHLSVAVSRYLFRTPEGVKNLVKYYDVERIHIIVCTPTIYFASPAA